MTLTELIQPVQSHFELFQEEYQHRTHSTAPLLKDVEEYLSHFLGKRLRPLMVLLSAEACGTMNSNHILVATIVEMLHNATLMHDDVVDESSLRRGHESVRHRWGNQVAVLCGDYYLARTMMTLHEMNDSNATSIINNTVRTMCEGELKQLASANRPLDEDGYIDIIGTKGVARMTHDFKTARVSLHGVTQTQELERPFGGKNIDRLVNLMADSVESGKRSEAMPTFRSSAIASEYAWRFLQDAHNHTLPSIGNLQTLEQIRERRRHMTDGYGLLPHRDDQ